MYTLQQVRESCTSDKFVRTLHVFIYMYIYMIYHRYMI